jgi:hypothetical protein
MTAEIEAALESNQFLATVVEEARTAIDAQRKPLQDEVDRLQDILENARQPKPTASARVEADKRIEKTQPLLEQATAELAKFDSKALETTYTKAKELAGDTLEADLETYKKRTGTFGSFWMGKRAKKAPAAAPDEFAMSNPLRTGTMPSPSAAQGQAPTLSAQYRSPAAIGMVQNLPPPQKPLSPLEIEKAPPTKAQQLGYVENPLGDKQTRPSESTTRVSPLGTGLTNRLGNFFNPGISAFGRRQTRLGPEKVVGTETGNVGAYKGGKRRTRRKGRKARKRTLKKRRGGK